MIVSSMMRLLTRSVSAPSRPRPTSMRSVWSSIATRSNAPSSRLVAAELPGVDDADRVLLDLLRLRRRHDEDGDLRALPRLECGELRLERLALSRRERAR